MQRPVCLPLHGLPQAKDSHWGMPLRVWILNLYAAQEYLYGGLQHYLIADGRAVGQGKDLTHDDVGGERSHEAAGRDAGVYLLEGAFFYLVGEVAGHEGDAPLVGFSPRKAATHCRTSRTLAGSLR